MDFLSLLGFVGDAIDSQLQTVVSWAAGGFSTLFGDISGVWSVLSGFIDWAKKAVGGIVQFLTGLWTWLRDHILSKIINIIREIIARVKQFLAPLIRWIQLERALLLQTWNQYVKPILNFIQHLRQALVLFRLLGFKWAKQLDQYLVNLENKINAGFLGAWRNLNILASWINWITDPLGLWSSNVWFGALGQSLSAIWAMVWGAPQVGLAGPGLATFDTPASYYDAATVNARVATRLAIGSLPEDSVLVSALRADAANDGYPPPPF
jgi:hypothetical protein